jgi:type IV pilus assembly protein PilP
MFYLRGKLMKRSRKLARVCRFTLFLSVFATAAFLVSAATADEPAAQKSGQAVVKPVPAAPAQITVKPLNTKGAKASGPCAAKLGAKDKAPPNGSHPVSTEDRDIAANRPANQTKETPAEISAIVKKTEMLLAAPKFTFLPDKGLDPFVPFVSLQPSGGPDQQGNAGPLTPLQRMSLAEMQSGLKAIVWGQMGRMAVIEDATGKGYIVSVGTPAGPNAGVITEINDNDLVIEQQLWNAKSKKRSPQNFTIKLIKKAASGAL